MLESFVAARLVLMSWATAPRNAEAVAFPFENEPILPPRGMVERRQ